jgi:hypothetical protein
VHHATDLREIMARIVYAWSQSYIVPIEAGLYRFRFGSAFSAEIRYLSKLSRSAMATFNFTLDETYLLKQEYERRLALAKDRQEDEFTIRSALGELYDFEEDFQQARHHYFAAILGLDHALKREYDGSVLRVLGIVRNAKEGASQSDPAEQETEIAAQGRAQINWSVPRVFHKLRIGLTYERTGDYVDALVHYRDARTIANSVLADLLSEIDRRIPVKGERSLANDPPWSETTKDLQLLLEPIFACAWIAEKSRSPSSGQTMMERGVRYTLQLLESKHHEFWLTNCDLHLKAGAFYALRGRGWQHLAYSHYAAAVLCVHQHIRDEGLANAESERVTQAVVGRLAPALLGMADACFAEGAEIYQSPDRLDVDASSVRVEAARIATAVGGPGDLPEEFGRLSRAYASSGDCMLLPTGAGVPDDAFRWFLQLSDAAASILEQGGSCERAERIWLITRRNVVVAMWAIRAWSALKGSTVPPKAARSLAGICEGPFATESARNDDCVPQFRRRVKLAARMACFLDRAARNDMQQLLKTDPYPVRGAIAMRENLLLFNYFFGPEFAEDTLAQLRDLMRLNGVYDSPMHFTPSAFGGIVALWVLQWPPSARHRSFLEEARHQAVEALRSGLGTVTRKGEYRRLLSSVYYLDDGFSDRELHVGHCQQMFLFELSSKLLEQLLALTSSERPAPDHKQAFEAPISIAPSGVRVRSRDTDTTDDTSGAP